MLPQRGAARRSRADFDCINCRRATLIAVGVEDVEMLCSPRGGLRMLPPPDTPWRLPVDEDAVVGRGPTPRAAGGEDAEMRDRIPAATPTDAAGAAATAGGARCGCSRPACGHPRGCGGVTEPNVVLGESNMALCAPQGGAVHAPPLL